MFFYKAKHFYRKQKIIRKRRIFLRKRNDFSRSSKIQIDQNLRFGEKYYIKKIATLYLFLKNNYHLIWFELLIDFLQLFQLTFLTTSSSAQNIHILDPLIFFH